ncbi:hypothetical protein [Bradyrhizobium sp.]|uniref:hypothetical protein n=1 Tax=Bradyrhizobium sp. TaxID=376 RepID=UPI001E1AB564|nr:hypothetical protein [Bradyrhizobium sp.]MBI5318864.1 hypothetical protein [Bradyrhizobium sp.]
MSGLTIQLEKLLDNAKRIKASEFTAVVNDYKDLFARYSFRLRPSVGSISLVSCSNQTPQLGFSNMTSGPVLRRRLAALKDGKELKAPDRQTPEKSLQSWLISEAMHNDGRLTSIELALKDHHTYWFAADEIALNATNENDSAEKGERVVADLLLVRTNGLDESELVNVELKSERTTRTHSQIKAFWRFIEPKQYALWREFAEVMLEKKLRWKELGKTKGLVIWPGLSRSSKSSDSTARLMAGYKTDGIDTICYFGPPYGFEAERCA